MKQNQRSWIWLFSWVCLGAGAGCSLFPGSTSESAKARPDHKFEHREAQFVFLSDMDISNKHDLFRELNGLRDQVFTELHLPPSSTLIQVHLFHDRDRYEQFMKTKYGDLHLPSRRAFFVEDRRSATSLNLMVYTYWSDTLAMDLRHELTHALLHSVLKGVPMWLDEGLAEYFETPPGTHGLNRDHLRELGKRPGTGQQFDLNRLERLEKIHSMAHEEYREAWAWVHFMMTANPQVRQVLLHYLRDLMSNPEPGPLRPRLARVEPSLNAALERHLAAMR